MLCELCGREIRGKVYRARFNSSILIICSYCASKHRNSVIGEYVTNVPRYTVKPKRSKFFLDKSEMYEIVEDCGERVREARESLGLTRELLAQMVGEKVSTIRRIEEGSLVPDLNLARKLEKALKIVLVEESTSYIPSEYKFSTNRDLTLGDIVEFKRKKK